MAELSLSREALEAELTKERDKARALGHDVDTLRQRYLELGGDVIGELEKTIAVQKTARERESPNMPYTIAACSSRSD